MKTVLVVDDTLVILELVKGLLEPEGYRVVTATSGEEATALFDEHHIDLSIVDIFLPGKGGLQVIGEITKQIKGHPVIAISSGEAFNPDAILELTHIFEVVATFTKPLDAKALVKTVKQALGDH